MGEVAERTPELFSKSIPTLQVAWDHTSLTYLKTCPRKYQYAILEGWQPKLTAAPLAFGMLLHKCLEMYDRLCHEFPQGEREGILRALVKYVLELTVLRNEDGSIKAFFQTSDAKRSRYNLLRTVVWYVDRFHGEALQTATLPNGKPALELSFRVELPYKTPDGDAYLYCGHIDKVGDRQGQLFVIERKHTVQTIGSYYFDKFAPNNQIDGYTFASSVLLNSVVSGTIVEAAQIAVNFSRFLRAPIARNSEQLEEWLGNLGHWMILAKQFAEQNFWPMNSESCHLYGGCTYRSICRLPAGARQSFLETNFERRLWDPLSSRDDEG